MRTMPERLNKLLVIISGLAVVSALFAMVLFIPFVLVWALNTLFPVLAIPYNIKTWGAALIIMAIMKPRVIDIVEKK